MIPKIHAKGSSFKGAAAYLLHDKDRAETSERVEWTETRNLAVSNPETAWKVMAATAMDASRLKDVAGIKNTGRKSNKHVLHFTLSWHPEQTPDKAEMMRAAEGALSALGASDHQALIIAHNDEPQPHIHILVNRVSPENGLILSSSYEKRFSSDWAREYEEETGIYCENRILNHQLRENGQYVRGQKDTARHIFEVQQGQSANDNQSAQTIRSEQKTKDHTLALKGRNMAKLHGVAWSKLEQAHKSRTTALTRDLARKIEKSRVSVIEEFRPAWLELNRVQASEKRTFAALEKSFFGKASNIVKTLKVSSSDIGEDKTGIISRSFRILTNAGARKEYFAQSQERARKALQRDQSNKVQDTAKSLKTAYKGRFAQNRAVFVEERADLSAKHNVEDTELRQAWKMRGSDRNAAFEKIAVIEKKQSTPHDGLGQTQMTDDYYKDLEKHLKLADGFGQYAEPIDEQDNAQSQDRDDGQER